MEKNRVLVLLSSICLVLVLLLACAPSVTPGATPASPQPSAPSPTASPTSAPVSFAGKTITIVVPQVPGGSEDLTARLFAQLLPKYLPGSPTMVVRDMPGGASTIAGNYAYAAKPDGLTLLMTSSSIPLNYILGKSAVKYDMTKFEAIFGSASASILYANPKIISNAEDLPKAKGIIWGHSESSSVTWWFVILKKLMPINPEKVILGYSSGSDARRAFLAGETNMCCEGLEAYFTSLAPFEAKGQVVPLMQTGIFNDKGELVRDPSFPNPNIRTGKEVYEKIYGKSPSGTAWDAYMALIAATRAYQNTLLLQSAVPDSIKRVYWDAAQKMLNDSEARKTMATLSGEKTPWSSGEAYSKQFKDHLKMDPQMVTWFKAALKEQGIVVD